MFYVGKFDESRFAVPHGYAQHSRGYERATLIDHAVGWVHMGASHAFYQTGEAPFRWIETQAPQFPARHGTRYYVDWDK